MSLAFPPSSVRAGSLCEDCRKIDFTEALKTQIDHDWASCDDYCGLFLAKITRFSRSCDLCNEFLLQKDYLRHYMNWLEDNKNWELRAFALLGRDASSASSMLRTLGTVWIHVVPVESWRTDSSHWRLKIYENYRGFIFVNFSVAPRRVYHPLVLHSIFDIGRAKQWIGACEQSHMDCCKPTASLPNLLLINCATHEIQRFSHPPPYVALSYVWGKAAPAKSLVSSKDTTNSRLPSTNLLSQVTKDALHVANALGLQYLWIDKYCVDQVDEKIQKYQIDNMDLVYNAAKLTIVAASGEDEHHGLPGVSSGRIQAQPFTTREFTVSRSTKGTLEAISCSRWAQRGWTFQEELLSRRRLYFLPDQVYFVCLNMRCWETQGSVELCPSSEAMDEYSNVTRHTKAHEFRYSYHVPDRVKMMEHCLVEFAGSLENYSLRELTFEKDALRAFAGVQRVFEIRSCPMGSIHGLPIPLSDYLSAENREFAVTFGLCWESIHTKAARRRGCFPTWTWAGWTGPIEMPSRIQIFGIRTFPRRIHCWYEDGYTASLEEVSQSLRAIVHGRSKRRNTQHLQSSVDQDVICTTRDWSLPKSIVFIVPCAKIDSLSISKSQHPSDWWCMKPLNGCLLYSGGCAIPLSMYSSDPNAFQEKDLAWLVLSIGDTRTVKMIDTREIFCLHLLLVEWNQPGEACRIGKMTISYTAENRHLVEEHIDSLPLVQVKLS